MNTMRLLTIATALLLVLAVRAENEPPPPNAEVKKHIAALKDPYWPNQYRAIEALAKLGPAASDAVPGLVAVLASKEPTVRVAAAEALGKIDPEARDVPAALAALLKDPQDHVRLAAADTLGSAGPAAKDAVPALAAALDDTNASVRTAAARSLGRLGLVARPAEPALRRAARSSDRTLSAAAGRALEEIAPPQAAWPALLTLPARGAAYFSPDGLRILSADADGDAIWDAATGKRLVTLRGGGERHPPCLTFRPDGRQVVGSVSSTGHLMMWEASTGDPAARGGFQVSAHQIGDVHFSPDGRLVAVLDEADAVTLWEARTGRKVRTLSPGGAQKSFEHESSSHHDLAFSPDGRRVAAVVRHEKRAYVVVWNLDEEQLPLEWELNSPTGIAFSPDGRRLAATTADGTVHLLELATNKEALTFGMRGYARGAAFSPDGRLLVTGWQWHSYGDPPGALILWDVATGEPQAVLRGIRGSIGSVAFSPDGRRVLAGGSRVRVWDLVARSLAPHELRHMVPEEFVAGLAFHDDGETLVVLRRGSKRPEDRPRLAPEHWVAVDCWNLKRNASKRSLRPLEIQRGFRTTLSGDGRTLVRVMARYGEEREGIVSTEVTLWDPIEGRELATFPGSASQLWSASFDAGGKRLALNFAPPLFRNASDERVWSLPLGEQMVKRDLVLSPDGRSFAALPQRDRSDKPVPVTIWELATGRERLRLPCDDHVQQLVYRSDGKLLAGIVGSWSYSTWAGEVRLWDAATGAELRTLAGNVAPILCIAFSPDGKVLATGGADETLRLWDLASGKELLHLDGLGDEVDVVAFSPDGSKIAASADRISVWNVAELLAQRRDKK